MLVKLYALPPLAPELDAMRAVDVSVRRARPYEASRVEAFVVAHFARSWGDEIRVGFARQPSSVWIAIAGGEVVGFAACECTMRGFFGPTGVRPDHRGRGVGRALLIAGLHDLSDRGYAYGIIGGAGPTEFYARSVGATPIDGSVPGVYGDALRRVD